MEIVTGALPTVLTKLGDLLVGEYNLRKGLKGEIRVLEAELRSMQGALEKISSTPADQVDSQDKIWASDVRELFYDIEDSIDTFLVHRHNKGSQLHGFDKFVDRSFKLLTRFFVGRKIATEVGDIRSRVVEVAELRDRYKIQTDAAHKPVTIDTRIFARYKNATELVGIDEERDTVINMLMEGNGVSQQQDHIVSIVGFGGLGKTTLANVVYEKLRGQFDCSAFVSVSQRPDMDKLFMDMFHQLGKETNASIDAIKDFLLEKRYIIIIDDIWDISVWNWIRCALPTNNCGYRIITTTRIYDVAKQVGGVYKMKPLSLHNSKRLLYGRIFGSEFKWNNEDTTKCPDERLAEVSNRILKKCAGVPLAIITIASLLASKGGNKIDWYDVCNSIGTGLEDGQDVDNMRKILSFSFYGMPSHLRTCLLYLSLFPEDYKISKDRLIRMWIAEGFIKYRKQGESLLEIGESYFNELINRSVIQPLCEEYNGLVDHCRVHDMMLDLICSISSEENFATILSDAHQTYLPKKVRRLSIQSNKVDHATLGASRSMLQVRSVVGFPNSANVNPALPSFKLLRVLELQHYEIYEDFSFKFLGYLLHLRYLGLKLYDMKPLPKEIGYLQFLQTLNIQCCIMSPTTLTLLPLRHLKSLLIDETYVVKGIGCLTTLEELSLKVDYSSSQDILEELGRLTELRVLSIRFHCVNRDASWEKSLVQFLCKLKKLRSLSIWWWSDHFFDLNLDGWVTPGLLCRFDTRLNQAGSKLSKLPAWMEDSSLLVDLSVISIRLAKLQQEDLDTLGRLPALRVLHLEVYRGADPIIGRFAFGAGSFPCLVHYMVWRVFNVFMFQEGAMPRLAVLEFTCPVREIREIAGGDGGFTLDLGFGNLPSLERVEVYMEAGGASKEEVTEVKAAMVHAAEIHPNHPTLNICDDFICFSDTDEDSDDESCGAEDEEGARPDPDSNSDE